MRGGVLRVGGWVGRRRVGHDILGREALDFKLDWTTKKKLTQRTIRNRRDGSVKKL